MEPAATPDILIQQLEEAFRPYPEFIALISAKIESLSSELDVERAHHETEIASIRSSVQTLEQEPVHSPEVEILKEKLANFEAERAKLIESFEKDRSFHASEKEELQTQLEALQAERASHSTEKESLQLQLEALKEEGDKLRASIERTRTIHASELGALRESLVTYEREKELPNAFVKEFGDRPRRARPTSEESRLQERKVLLVDDAEINRVLMSHYFKGLPVKLDFASTGELAFSKCQNSSFDLIVIDAEIQNPTGSDLAQRLKESGTKGLMVALSNQEQLGVTAPGFSHTLSRGLSRESLIEQLKSFLWVA